MESHGKIILKAYYGNDRQELFLEDQTLSRIIKAHKEQDFL